MARKLKPVEVQKFGGTEALGKTKFNGYEHEIQGVETQSKTNLEQDQGAGNAAIIRMFEFKANTEVFQEHPPTKQDLFNAHHKGIELALWKDGLKVMPEVTPQIAIGKDKYSIWVGAIPMKGHILQEQTRTLSQLAHG